MPYQFACPYCFRRIRDDEVLFRSEKVTSPRPTPKSAVSDAQKLADELLPATLPVKTDEERDALPELRRTLAEMLESDEEIAGESLFPEEFADWQEFNNLFPDGALKTALSELPERLQAIRNDPKRNPQPSADSDSFFDRSDDPVYQRFWEKYADGKTTETDTEYDREPWRRRILDPKNKVHQAYLKVQSDGTFFIRDADGMAAKIQLKDDDSECYRRVCPYCHNPLPAEYGKNPVRFLTIIGITGSGKTVYLYKLFEEMGRYVAKAHLNAFETPSVMQFLSDNAIVDGQPMPGSTTVYLHQPLFFDLVRSTGVNEKRVETLVLYDVTGETFEDPRRTGDALKYSPFIRYADGIILLIDPEQFPAFVGAKAGRNLRYKPTQALRNIHSIVTNGDAHKKCRKPIAICISKMDEMMNLFPDDLRQRLSEEVEGIRDNRGFYEPLFNAKAYNPILDGLYAFFQNYDESLSLMMDNNFRNYAYFAFTALGCAVDSATGRPVKENEHITTRRIEEPLLWFFHCFDYIKANAKIDYPYQRVPCPSCGKTDTYVLPLEEREIRYGFLNLKRRYINRCCNECGKRWFDDWTEKEELSELSEGTP